MFDDLIKMLLVKKAEVKATDAKIDELLKKCGYVAPVEEVVEETNENQVNEVVYNETI